MLHGPTPPSVLWSALALLAIACPAPGQRALDRGNVAAHAGKLDEAARAFSQAATERPNDPTPHRLLGAVALARRDATQALPAFARAHELAPDDLEATVGLARAQLELGDAGAAETTLGSLEATNDVPLACLRTRLALAQGDAVKAQSVLGALQTAPTPEVKYLLGLALLAARRYGDAQAAFDEVGRLAPQSPLAAWGNARLAAAQTRRTDVLLYLREVRLKAGPAFSADDVRADPAFGFLAADPELTRVLEGT